MGSDPMGSDPMGSDPVVPDPMRSDTVGSAPWVRPMQPEEPLPVLLVIAENELCDADADEGPPLVSHYRKSRKKRWLRNLLKSTTGDYFVAAAATSATHEHAEIVDKEAMQQVVKDEGKVIVPTAQVRNSVGPELEKWKLAAESELTKNFLDIGVFHESSPEELKQHGRPLPMLCVWFQIVATGCY